MKYSSPKHGLKYAVLDVITGVKCGYPLCCVVAFSMHTLLNINYRCDVNDNIYDHSGITKKGSRYRMCGLHKKTKRRAEIVFKDDVPVTWDIYETT